MQAEASRAVAVRAEQSVISAREIERTERDAATRRAGTVRVLAEAEADAERLRNDARGRQALNEAENIASRPPD